MDLRTSKLQQFRDRQVLTPEQSQHIRDTMDTLVKEDMSDYEVVKKIADLTPYMTDGTPDEARMIKTHKFLNTAGIHPDPEASSFLDSDVVVRYQYEGPRDSHNRDFCAYMMQNFSGSYFRREDINQMSFSMANNDFGVYSIWQYKGSYACRHSWVGYIFRPKKSGEGIVIRRSVDESSLVNPVPQQTNRDGI